MTTEDTHLDLLTHLSGQIVAAYVERNAVGAGELPALIRQVHGALRDLGRAGERQPESEQQPAVSVRKSVTPGHLVCLEDGATFKSLKRHLQNAHGLTPAEYRTKWKLPKDYPMVAPNYAATRSKLATEFGLGRKAAAAVPTPQAAPEADAVAAPKRRGRKAKAAAS